MYYNQAQTTNFQCQYNNNIRPENTRKNSCDHELKQQSKLNEDFQNQSSFDNNIKFNTLQYFQNIEFQTQTQSIIKGKEYQIQDLKKVAELVVQRRKEKHLEKYLEQI